MHVVCELLKQVVLLALSLDILSDLLLLSGYDAVFFDRLPFLVDDILAKILDLLL